MPRSLLSSAALVAVVLALASPARSAGKPSAEVPTDRWVPSLTANFIYMNYHADGRIETSLGFPAQGGPSESTPFFQFGLEMLSPAATHVPTAPHLVGFGGLQVGPAHKLDLAGAGRLVPGDPERTLQNLINRPPQTYPAAADIQGQGSELVGRYRTLGWYLGVGVVFDIPTHDPIFRLRPYVTYVGEQARMKGQVVQVSGTGPNYVLDRVQATDEEMYQYLGPGLELEVLLNTNENWAISFFARSDFLWNVGNSSSTFSDPTGQATFHYTTDDFQPRVGAGLRVSWLSAF